VIFGALAVSRRIRRRGVSFNLLYRGDAAAGAILATKYTAAPCGFLEGHAAIEKEFKALSCRSRRKRY